MFSSLVHLYANFEMWVLSLLNSAFKNPPNQPQICPNSALKKNPSALTLSPKSALIQPLKKAPNAPRLSPKTVP